MRVMSRIGSSTEKSYYAQETPSDTREHGMFRYRGSTTTYMQEQSSFGTRFTKLLNSQRYFETSRIHLQPSCITCTGLEPVDQSMLPVDSSEPLQRINNNSAMRFRVSIGHENGRFNLRAYIDIICIDGRPHLYIVDEANRFSSACFSTKVSTNSVRNSIILCTFSIYTGLPQTIMV